MYSFKSGSGGRKLSHACILISPPDPVRKGNVPSGIINWFNLLAPLVKRIRSE